MQVTNDEYPLLLRSKITCSPFSIRSLTASSKSKEKCPLVFFIISFISIILILGSFFPLILLGNSKSLKTPFLALAKASNDGVALPNITGQL